MFTAKGFDTATQVQLTVSVTAPFVPCLHRCNLLCWSFCALLPQAAGVAALKEVIAAIPDDIPVLLDAKRGDIGTTAAAYASAAFQVSYPGLL